MSLLVDCQITDYSIAEGMLQPCSANMVYQLVLLACQLVIKVMKLFKSRLFISRTENLVKKVDVSQDSNYLNEKSSRSDYSLLGYDQINSETGNLLFKSMFKQGKLNKSNIQSKNTSIIRGSCNYVMLSRLSGKSNIIPDISKLLISGNEKKLVIQSIKNKSNQFDRNYQSKSMKIDHRSDMELVKSESKLERFNLIMNQSYGYVMYYVTLYVMQEPPYKRVFIFVFVSFSDYN
jgi:hypothetical protein